MAETGKARTRREREGWFARFAPEDMPGIDIGCGSDPIHAGYRKWDLGLGDPDATTMDGVGEWTYFTVYASHVLEHLADPITALRSWYKITMSGGYLIVCVPHRDLYERRKELPSRWNADHKHFWLPEQGEPPCTRGLRDSVCEAIPDANIICLRVLDEGFYDPGEEHHAHGEYSIEVIVQKP